MGVIAIKDKVNNDWVLQNQETGDIIRFSFSNENETKKSQFPTLIDLKITDSCNIGCPFCYQSSTDNEKHARLNTSWEEQKAGKVSFSHLLTVLKNMGVLEIVIGGGEPTQHPQIYSALHNIKQMGFVSGITTKNYRLGSQSNFKQIIQNIDTIAVSCNTPEEVERAKALHDDIFALNVVHKVKMPAFYVQNILGLTSLEKLKQFLDTCRKNDLTNVTLLGYKDFGFGKNIKSKEIDASWIDLVKDSGLNIGIDSVVVSRWKEELLKKGIRKEYLVEGEGKFSMYVDAVEQTISASSFTEKKVKYQYPSQYDWEEILRENFLKIFSSF